jgi:hypothetical protein
MDVQQDPERPFLQAKPRVAVKDAGSDGLLQHSDAGVVEALIC